jgi:hypothetical protein
VTERKGIQSERLYNATPQAILEKQHDRLRTIAMAFVQAHGWMRACDVTREESALHGAVCEFLRCPKEKTG